MTQPKPGEGGSAGFVLAGGHSSRMGCDKALLPLGSRTLVEEIAQRVRAAAGSVTLVGPAERYRHLNLPLIEDQEPGLGPLGGLHAALAATTGDWNLVVACDMPGLDEGFLRQLVLAAPTCGRLALVPFTSRGWEPLCAVYHRELVHQVHRFLTHNMLKMQEFVARIEAAAWPVPDASLLANVNTREDWEVQHR